MVGEKKNFFLRDRYWDPSVFLSVCHSGPYLDLGWSYMAHLGLIWTGISSCCSFWGYVTGVFYFWLKFEKKCFLSIFYLVKFKEISQFLCLLSLISIRGVRKTTFYFIFYKYLVVRGWVKKSKFWSIFELVNFFFNTFFWLIRWCWIFFNLEQNSVRNTRNKNRVLWFLGFFEVFLKIWFQIRNQHKILRDFENFQSDFGHWTAYWF